MSKKDLRDRIAKAADFSRKSGWYFDKEGDRLNATHKVDAIEKLIEQEIAEAQEALLRDLSDCGELHHMVLDYRLAELKSLQEGNNS